MRTLGRLRARSLLLLTLTFLTPSLVSAQTGAASLTGIVTDESGAAVPGATVTATNQATNVDYTARLQRRRQLHHHVAAGRHLRRQGGAVALQDRGDQADPDGSEADRAPRLQAGARRASRRPSRSRATRRSCRPRRRRSARSSRARRSVALPLNGRNTGQLSLLLPGAVTPNPSAFTAIRNFSGGRPFVNGNREQTNNYTIDGVDMNETIDNLVAYQPSPDALAEISVETNNYAADTGNVGGAVISNVIKSGSNQFRGNAFEFYRNSDFDANTWENNRSGAAKQERRQHIYGGTLGGPLVKNKLFFFGNYQGTRYDAPGFETVSVAPEAWRRGDLSSVTSADPRSA